MSAGSEPRPGDGPGRTDREEGASAERSDRDPRFEAWLRAAAADYHRPPSTPRDPMWARVEAGWRRVASAGDPFDGRAPASPFPEGAAEGDDLLGPATGYHAPPPTPRDEMWGRIEAAWRLRRGAGGTGGRPQRAASGSPAPSPGIPRRSGEAWPGWAWAAAIAAVLLVGIGIGRLSVGESGDASRAGTEAVATGLEGNEAAPASVRDEGSPGIDGRSGADAMAGRVTPGADAASPPGDAPGRGGADGATREDEAGVDGRGEASVRLAVRAQTIDHLGRTEAFLTSFRADTELRGEDGQATRWARDLLSETRLLLDWGAARDPVLRSLLEELEFVLVRIARLEAGRSGGERELIVDQMEREDVLSRLRTVVPAGPAMPDRTGV